MTGELVLFREEIFTYAKPWRARLTLPYSARIAHSSSLAIESIRASHHAPQETFGRS